MRKSSVARISKETSMSVGLNIDGSGKYEISTPVNFLNHMLEGFTKHGVFNLKVEAKGDLEIDQHHTLEDLGILIGQACKKSLGDKKGINRSGFFSFPMDDSLGIVSIDLSGRPYSVFKVKFKRKIAGDLDLDCISEFFSGFSMGAGCNISVYVPYGENDHHKIEAIFKAFGKALAMACSKNKNLKNSLPTTKGILDKL